MSSQALLHIIAAFNLARSPLRAESKHVAFRSIVCSHKQRLEAVGLGTCSKLMQFATNVGIVVILFNDLAVCVLLILRNIASTWTFQGTRLNLQLTSRLAPRNLLVLGAVKVQKKQMLLCAR